MAFTLGIGDIPASEGAGPPPLGLGDIRLALGSSDI
jgi:hypothetical protein